MYISENNFLWFGDIITMPTDYNFALKVKPSTYINNKLYIHSVANLIIASLFDSENIITKHKHTLEYILNELVTNAVKYSMEASEIKIMALKENDRVYFKITNIISDNMLITFRDFLITAYSKNPREIFLERIDSLCSRIHDSIENSGIGIMTLLNDYELRLSYEINMFGKDANIITTTFYWDTI